MFACNLIHSSPHRAASSLHVHRTRAVRHAQARRVRTPEKTEPALNKKQNELHSRVSDWFCKEFGVSLNHSAEFVLRQPEESLSTMENHLTQLNDWELSCLDLLSCMLLNFRSCVFTLLLNCTVKRRGNR
jgi:chaperone required for assembly of F1-ATPase